MSLDTGSPPYFDLLFQRLADGHPGTATAFGRHVHWGYWDQPDQATSDATGYAAAAERLCALVCEAGRCDSNQQIVDVGCGFGGTLRRLNEQFESLHMTGINIDPRQLQRARQQVVARGGNQIAFVESPAERLPIADETADTVLAVEAVFHFDRQAFFAEAARVLKPGGCLALSDFVPEEKMVAFIAGADLSGDEAIRWAYGSIDLSYSIAAYQQLADAVGLRLEGIHDINAGTLPTYPFLYQNIQDWPHQADIDRFTKATRWLEKACRKGLLRYTILSFVKPTYTQAST